MLLVMTVVAVVTSGAAIKSGCHVRELFVFPSGLGFGERFSGKSRVDLAFVARSATAAHLAAKSCEFVLSGLVKFPVSQSATPTPGTQSAPHKSSAPSNDSPLSTIKALLTCLGSTAEQLGSCCGGLV